MIAARVLPSRGDVAVVRLIEPSGLNVPFEIRRSLSSSGRYEGSWASAGLGTNSLPAATDSNSLNARLTREQEHELRYGGGMSAAWAAKSAVILTWVPTSSSARKSAAFSSDL